MLERLAALAVLLFVCAAVVAWQQRARPTAPARLRARRQDGERGDVPGWVLVTVMTAGLVTALWLVADGQLRTILTNALNGVTGP